MSGDIIKYPDNPIDFIKGFSFKDEKELYTNGVELVPVFRVEQMIEHYINRKGEETMKNLTVERIVTVELTVIDRDVKEDMSNLRSDDELGKCIRVSAKNLLNVDDAQIKSVKTFIHEPSRRSR